MSSPAMDSRVTLPVGGDAMPLRRSSLTGGSTTAVSWSPSTHPVSIPVAYRHGCAQKKESDQSFEATSHYQHFRCARSASQQAG